MDVEDEKTFILQLIVNVEKQQCLYDKTDAFYYNRNVRERAWKEVSQMCSKSEEDCKHRWKLLRERFCKELKRIEAPSGSGMRYLKEWRFMQPMMFLKSSLAPRRTRDNVEQQDTDSLLSQSAVSEDSLLEHPTSSTPAPPKKVKITIDSLYQKFGETIENIEKNCIAPPEQDTTDEAFMKTVVCLMKNLPVAVKDEFQEGMLLELYRLRRENRNNSLIA